MEEISKDISLPVISVRYNPKVGTPFLSPVTIIGRTQTLPWTDTETMSRDPVCGTVLNEKTSKFKITYDGETYHFCSLTCKKRFKRQPAKFVK